MAKLIVRKQEPGGDPLFDEQLWPVQIAILVLGGYLVGCVLVFCEPAAPWYRNTYVYLGLITGLIAAALWGATFLENRLLKRAIQLAAVLSIALHVMMILFAYLFGKFTPPPQMALTKEDAKKITRPLVPRQEHQNVWTRETLQQPKRDFERPLETKTPETAQATPTPRAETKPDEREPTPQPQPVPKPEQTARPAVEKRVEDAPAVPRHSEQQSKLTRNMQKTELKPLVPHVENPAATPDSKSPALPSAADVAGSKVATPTEVKAAPTEDPGTPSPQPTVQIAKKTPDAAPPQHNAAATPQLPRKLNQPTSVPKTSVAVADETAQPKETQPDATQPALVAVNKQNNPAPEMARNTTEPTPAATLTAQQEPTKRASTPDAAAQPALEPSQLARQVVKSNPLAAQTLAAREPATAARESPAKVAARETPIDRAVTKVEVKPAVAQPSAQPIPTSSPTVASRTQAQPSEAKPVESVAAVQRTIQPTRIDTQVAAAQAQPNANPNNTGSAIAAQNVSASRQATAAPQVAVNAPRPSPTTAQQPTRDPASRQEATEKIETPAPATAQIARAATRSPTPASSPVATPEATAEAAPNPAIIAARQAAAEKSTTEVNIAAKASAPSADPSQPSATSVARTQALARAPPAASEPVPQSTTSPSPSRTQVASALSRPTTADAPQLAAASAETNAQGTPGPASTAVSKQAGASAQLAQKIAEPSLETPTEVKPETVTRRQPGQSAATVAQTPTPSPTVERKVLTSQPLASSVAAADPSPTRAPVSEQGIPQASEASVARQSNPGRATIASATVQPTATASASAQPARAAVARATLSPTATIHPTAQPTASPARAALASAVPTSPQAIESPAGAESSRATDHPSAEPARMVLSRSIAGSAGIGSDINLDRGLPAPTSPARVASASAKRAEAVQNTPQGPALAPSETPQVARSQAGGAAPSSAVAANTGDAATEAGAPQASELTASSSASVTRNSSNATRAEFSAAAGSMDLDTGATQIVSSIGAGRAAGGGQPELNPNTQAKALARATPGGAPAMAITAATVTPEAAAPSGKGGGQPAVLEASPTAAAVVKTNAGGAQPVSGGPAGDAPAGPTAEAARAEMVASAEVGRATPLESAPAAAQAGGGNERPSRSSSGQAIVLNSQANVPAITGGPTAGAGPTVAGGGQAAPLEATASAAATRTENGGVPEVGGRSVAAEVGPPAETRSVAAVASARSAAQETGPAAQVAATGAPALARSGGPASLAAPAQAAVPLPGGPPGPAGPAAGGAPALEASAAGTQVARAQPAGGAPVAGGLASKEDEEVGPVALTPGGDLIASLESGRATTSDAQPGLPQAETGRGSPSRAAGQRSAPATSSGANTQLAGGPMPSGAPSSSGNPAGIPVDAAGVAATRGTAGISGPAGAAAPGAEVGPVPLDAVAGGPAITAIGTQKASSADDGGPAPLTAANAGAPLKRADRPGIPAGGVVGPVAISVPAPGPMNPERSGSQPDMSRLAGDVSAGPTTKTSAGAVALAADAPEGPGGLGSEMTPDVGVITRQSQKESEALAFTPARFLRQKAGGVPSINTTAVIAADAFSQRRSASLRRGDTSGGNIGRPPRATEEAIELGLRYLSRHQMPDGSWSLINYTVGRPGYNNERLPQMNSDTAATGMSLLCFFGAGYHHKDDRYQQEIARGVEWLVKNQQADGNLYVSQDPESNKSAALYSHAIATIALCEAYGMTQDPDLKEPAQKALDYIVAAQHKDRGGWRYSPGTGADTSVSGWMVMALKSGQLSNLKVPPEVYEKAKKWLATAKGPRGEEHLYVYNPYAPDTEAQRHGRRPTKVMTAVGMLTNMYLGANRNDTDMRKGADYLLENLPALGDPRNPQRDTYYWYYATQVMFHMKGDHWKKWNDKLHPLLTSTQVRTGPLAGSWEPYGTVPDRWAHYGGRVYLTAMNLLSLEVTYRHLPIYEETAK